MGGRALRILVILLDRAKAGAPWSAAILIFAMPAKRTKEDRSYEA